MEIEADEPDTADEGDTHSSTRSKEVIQHIIFPDFLDNWAQRDDSAMFPLGAELVVRGRVHRSRSGVYLPRVGNPEACRRPTSPHMTIQGRTL